MLSQCFLPCFSVFFFKWKAIDIFFFASCIHYKHWIMEITKKSQCSEKEVGKHNVFFFLSPNNILLRFNNKNIIDENLQQIQWKHKKKLKRENILRCHVLFFCIKCYLVSEILMCHAGCFKHCRLSTIFFSTAWHFYRFLCMCVLNGKIISKKKILSRWW